MTLIARSIDVKTPKHIRTECQQLSHKNDTGGYDQTLCELADVRKKQN